MFERYTEKARRTIFFARYEASQFGSESIETEHLLLGLFREDPELAIRFLGPDAVDAGEASKVRSIRRHIKAITQRRPKVSTSVDLPLSHECKHVLTYGAEEAERLNHQHVGTQHLLLGLLRQEESLAARILRDHGLRLPLVREEISLSSPAEAGPGGARARSARLSAVQDRARHEAAERRNPCIGTTDLLLALTHEKEVAERFLGPVEAIRKHPKLDRISGERVSEVELAFSEDCKLAFSYATEEAAQLGQRTGPAHLLLGLLRVESCAAAEILRECGLTEAGIRAQLRPPPPSSDPEQGRSYV